MPKPLRPLALPLRSHDPHGTAAHDEHHRTILCRRQGDEPFAAAATGLPARAAIRRAAVAAAAPATNTFSAAYSSWSADLAPRRARAILHCRLQRRRQGVRFLNHCHDYFCRFDHQSCSFSWRVRAAAARPCWPHTDLIHFWACPVAGPARPRWDGATTPTRGFVRALAVVEAPVWAPARMDRMQGRRHPATAT